MSSPTARRAVVFVTKTTGKMIGQVTAERFEQLLEAGRDLLEQQKAAQFGLGDIALEIEPMGTAGQAGPGESLFTVSEALKLYADGLRISVKTLENWRWVASRWPAKWRRVGVPYTVFRVLASAEDRFERIDDPPMHEPAGEPRWTADEASRLMGRVVKTPVSTEEKVQHIRSLAWEDDVAAETVKELLHRPAVARAAMRDVGARSYVNTAQFENARESGETVRKVNPVLARVEHSMQFVDLIGVCVGFVTGAGKVIPNLRGHEFTADERSVIGENIARIRAVADWLDSVLESGAVDLDEALAQILKGE